MRRSAFSFACVGIVVVMSSYVIFILAAMRLYNSISISFRFVGRARSCLESLLRRIAGCRLPWRISDPGASAHWPTPVRLSLSSVHLPSAWRNNRLSSVIGNAIREESRGCNCKGCRVICQQFSLLSVGGNTLCLSESAGQVCGQALLAWLTVLLAMVVPPQSAGRVSSSPRNHTCWTCAGKNPFGF